MLLQLSLRPFRFLAVPLLGRREELRAARLPPRKFCCAAERVSELVRWLGATGGFPKYTPHLHSITPAARIPSGFFFLPSLLFKPSC